jgi:hypothetical protein
MLSVAGKPSICSYLHYGRSSRGNSIRQHGPRFDCPWHRLPYRRWHVPLSSPRAHRQWLEALRGWHMDFPRLWVTHVQYVMKPVAISSRSARFSASRGGFAREHLLVVALSAVRGATQRHQESRRTSPRPATRPARMGSYLQYIRWSVGDVVTARTPRGSVELSRVCCSSHSVPCSSQCEDPWGLIKHRNAICGWKALDM